MIKTLNMEFKQLDLFKDHSRGKHTIESKAAFKIGNKDQDRMTVYELCNGIRNTKDIQLLMNKPGLNNISGRFTDLMIVGLIHVTGHRDGCRIYSKIENKDYNQLLFLKQKKAE